MTEHKDLQKIADITDSAIANRLATAHRLVDGDLRATSKLDQAAASADEIGTRMRAFQRAIASLQEMAARAEQIAEGDLFGTTMGHLLSFVSTHLDPLPFPGVHSIEQMFSYHGR